MATTYTIKKGTTYLGFNVESTTVNGDFVDLTDANIIVEVISEKKGCAKHTYTIGKGVEITNAVEGGFIILQDTVINWDYGRWYLIVTITTAVYGTKKWIYKDRIFNIV